LLKAKSENIGVAQKLIATTAELDQIAGGQRNGRSMSGWRAKVFGDDAVQLCDGKLALMAKGKTVDVIKI